MKWVKLHKYCDLTGDTPDAVYGKNRKRIWTSGVQYRKAPDGCIWVNLDEVEKWVAQTPQTQPQPLPQPVHRAA